MNAKKFKRMLDDRKLRIVCVYNQHVTEEGQTIIRCRVVSK